jgi:hypothetical protein
MRKVILQEIVSLDGYAAGPNGDVNFIPASTRGELVDAHGLDRGAVSLLYRQRA